jgi:prepilin-type N-terminal cleavage/methylation domain-containing protein
MNKLHSQRGFTLIEVLVALAAMGLLIVGLSQGWRLGLDGWRRQSALLQSQTDLHSVDRSLRRLLAGAASDASDGDSPFFGGQNTLEATVTLPEAYALAGRRGRIVLLVDRSRSLLMNWKSQLRSAGTGKPLSGTVALLTRVERVEFAYWGSGHEAGGTDEWRSSWRGIEASPHLIRIHIVFPSGDPRHWPDIVVEPMVRSEAP